MFVAAQKRQLLSNFEPEIELKNKLATISFAKFKLLARKVFVLTYYPHRSGEPYRSRFLCYLSSITIPFTCRYSIMLVVCISVTRTIGQYNL